MMRYIVRSFLLMLVFTAVLGIIYPCLIFLAGQIFCKNKANGSFLEREGKIIGSSLIGQAFSSEKYFHSRPSASRYDGMDSESSNLSMSSEKLYARIKKDEEEYRKTNNVPGEILPLDALTESASGLDPHISKKNAYLQAKRISENRNISIKTVIELIDSYLEKPTFYILGNERVNVLLLNIALDEIEP